MTNPMTLERLRHCRDIAATVVHLHGDQYLPHFEKMQKEVEVRERSENVRALAAKFANPNLLKRRSKKLSGHANGAGT
ncbi:hypothetical protein SAMN04515647_3673 [Cohaesibacter sp. ES.047]|uniref:hypothetical protein n=1 Tax=Cohaesibacter sp. ES.047 TaxID=1798205 RepID=UPI000BB7F477|nr:hypothetical protein [Cohaesibacter sp. ES.047]SNY93378.1 hypothetical protein SAMN04515647_3673 [Cohaesibacter sp. ES.047]